MCGIVGYFGEDALRKGLQCLNRLSYRGYDSAGFAINESLIYSIKEVGDVENLIKKSMDLRINANCGIFHTRWATHGGVTDKNSHPHFSQDKKIAVVHNGILENYETLKKNLIEKGYSFESETDTEVIPKLIGSFEQSGDSMIIAIEKTLPLLEGSYAIAVIKECEKRIYFARKNSPLLIGIGEKEKIICSDSIGFLPITNKYICLDDDEYGYIDGCIDNGIDGEIKIFNQGKLIKKEVKTIPFNFEAGNKGEYNYFMMKEIMEQPSIIDKIISNENIKELSKCLDIIKKYSKIYLTGCGSSYHACLLGKYYLEDIANLPVTAILSSEFSSQLKFCKDSIVIAISQSGETADVLEASKNAKKHGAKIIAFVNTPNSSLARISDCIIELLAGPEICVLSTKSYIAQSSMLLVLAALLKGESEKIIWEWNSAKKEFENLLEYWTEKSIRLADKLKNSKSLFVIGRGQAYPIALEAALKIKEASYIHAEGFAGGELKHGTLALIEKGTPALVICDEENRKDVLSNAHEIKAREGFIIGIDSENNSIYDEFIKVPLHFKPLFSIVPIQIFAYHIALARGLNPDKPRNLAKSVTVK